MFAIESVSATPVCAELAWNDDEQTWLRIQQLGQRGDKGSTLTAKSGAKWDAK